MADPSEVEAESSSPPMSPDVSPTSSPEPSPPMSPRTRAESQPQRECKELLTDPDGTNLFRTYLKGAYASEVLNLWIEIQLYKKLGEQDKLQKKGQFIYEKYCKEGESEVNIDESLRVAVKTALDNNSLELTTFDNIQTQVFDLLWTDCFMGFRHTDTYTNYLLQKNNKQGTQPRHRFLFCFLQLFFSIFTECFTTPSISCLKHNISH